MIDKICVCGHIRSVHLDNGYVCWKCHEEFKDGNFHTFKVDNLRFLEEIAYQKGLEQYNKSKRLRAKRVN